MDKVFVTVCLFFQTISHKPMQLVSPNLTYNCSTMGPGNTIYFRIKRSRSQRLCWSSDRMQYCRCCDVHTLCSTVGFTCCNAPSHKQCYRHWVFPASLPRTWFPLDAGFSPVWVSALLWVPASSSLQWLCHDDSAGNIAFVLSVNLLMMMMLMMMMMMTTDVTVNGVEMDADKDWWDTSWRRLHRLRWPLRNGVSMSWHARQPGVDIRRGLSPQSVHLSCDDTETTAYCIWPTTETSDI